MSLDTILTELELDQYLDILIENGFDTWEVVQDITEDDLRQLGFKLGHRRILQRAIADSPVGDTRSRSSTPLSRADHHRHSHESSEGNFVKRRYRRHPRPDPYAPKRPKTAYVMFADHVRTDPVVSSLSFTEISRAVGMRWQALPREEKYLWDIQAARAMQVYTQAMEQYRKTDAFREHQRYLAEFRRQHEPPSNDDCRLSPPTQRPSLEASRGFSSSSGSSESTLVEANDDSARFVDVDDTELTANEIADLQEDRGGRGRSASRSSIYALLEAAEASDRIKSYQ